MERINSIPKGKYEGYVWYSDQKEPQVLKGEEEFQFSQQESANPFVIEALLYDREKEISIMVRYTGQYIVSEFNLKKLAEGAVLEQVKKYMPHRLEGVKGINFKQLWLPEEDPNCDNMEVLILKAHIFTGFSS